VRGDLDWIVMKALEKDRARRYETANGFAADVLRYLSGEAVLAVPPSAGYRARKFVYRHRAVVLTIAAFAILLLAGVALSTWQAVVAIRAEKEAKSQRDAADKARDAEAEARKQTEVALSDSRRKTASTTYERAQALCEEGRADLGLAWMARSLELTPAGAVDLDRTIRTSMNMWAGQLNTIRPMPDSTDWNKVTNICDVAVSPDGLSVLTVNLDVQGQVQVVNVKVWEMSNGSLRFTLPREKDAQPSVDDWSGIRATFSPDGRFVAAALGDKRARLWSAVSGQPIGKPLAHQESIRGVGFDPSGKVLATAAGKKIRFWSVERGLEEGEPLALKQDALGVEFSGDGRHLLTWGVNEIRLWEVSSRKLLRGLAGVDFSVRHACFSPDGRFVLANGHQTLPSGLWQLMAQHWEVATGQPVGARMKWESYGGGSGYNSTRCAFRPDGRLAVIGASPLRLWQVPSGVPVGTTTDGDLYDGAERPAFGRDGKVLVSIPFGGRKYLLNLAPALEASQQLPSPGRGFLNLATGPDGRSVAAVKRAWDQNQLSVRLLDLSSGRAIGAPIEMDAVPGRYFLCVPAFRPDGRAVATGVGKNGCQIWDTMTGCELGPGLGMSSYVQALAFSPDGRILAGGDRSGEIRIWNAITGRLVETPIRHQYAIRKLCFSSDGSKLLAVGGQGGGIVGEARAWDMATSRPLGPPLEILGGVEDAAFSPDGKTFVTAAFQLVL
jgi:WD40 repeat protein